MSGGVDVNVRDLEGLIVLIVVFEIGYVEIVKKLLVIGLDVNGNDIDGWVFLMGVVVSGN